MKANNLLTTWLVFLNNPNHRFGVSIYEDHQGQLTKLIHASSIAEYQCAFEDLMNKIMGISETFLINFFIIGLKLDICRDL